MHLHKKIDSLWNYELVILITVNINVKFKLEFETKFSHGHEEYDVIQISG